MVDDFEVIDDSEPEPVEPRYIAPPAAPPLRRVLPVRRAADDGFYGAMLRLRIVDWTLMVMGFIYMGCAGLVLSMVVPEFAYARGVERLTVIYGIVWALGLAGFGILLIGVGAAFRMLGIIGSAAKRIAARG